MSLQERLAAQDPLQLLTIATGLAFSNAASSVGDKYNLPLMLFGMIAHEIPSSTFLLRQFLMLTLFSGILDVYTLLVHSSGLTMLFTILLVLLKAPIYITLSNKLRERGGEMNFGQGSWGFQGLPSGGGGGGAGRAEQGNSNWNMPGGFNAQPASSRSAPAPPPPPGQFPSSGGFRLGSEEDEQDSKAPPPPLGPGRGGYQAIA